MSLIPKINVGLRTKKSARNVSCLVHGTSEIGYVLPTYCRNYINDAHIKLGTRTGVRLSPLFVPTMGNLSIRHYHDFVPFNRVWAAFDAFLAHEPYAYSAGVSIPNMIMSFQTHDLIGKLLNDECHLSAANPISSDPFVPNIDTFIKNSKIAKWLTCSIYRKSDGNYVTAYVSEDTDNALLLALFRNSSPWNYAITPSFIRNHDEDGGENSTYFVAFTNSNQYELSEVQPVNTFTNNEYAEYLSELSFPSLYHCDWSYQVNYDGVEYQVCFNWNGALKRLRSIFLGLGYSFNPFDNEPDNVLKLLAFYRCWFSHFGVTRSINFNDTACAKVTRYINSTKIGNIILSNSIMSGTGGAGGIGQLFFEFIESLLDLTYTCPPDYFTSAMQNPSEGAQDGISLTTPYNAAGLATASGSASQVNGVEFGSGNNIYSVLIAQRLLRFVNRNNVVGRKIVDILRSRYGDIKTDDESSEGVFRLGSDNTEIEIGAIYNQSDFSIMDGSDPLGSYAGVGTGGSRSKPVNFTTPSFGCLITLTAVVPEMGYFQGKLRENSDGVSDWRDFYNPDFDALGWQTVRYNELIADRTHQMSGLPSGTSLGAYGYQPRFTHLKVGFNRVLGDLSLPHMIDSMLPYTLDRYFDPRDASLPVNSPTVSRKGTIGNLNRIFQVTAPTDDHIIYQIYFDISVNDSMKSLQVSYDTVTSGDNSSIEVSHE